MHIAQYEYQDPQGKGWRFSKVEFGRVNLVVGDSGMGKTRLLNTIFNLGSQVTSKRAVPGQWYLALEGEEARYEWTIGAESHPERGNLVSEELLCRHAGGEETTLVDRKRDEFVFKGNLLPKLSQKETSISLLQEEDDIKPLYDTFSRMMRRRFYEAELSENCSIGGFPFGMLDRISQGRELGELFQVRAQHNLNLNGTLAILANHFRGTFDEICSLYTEVFPFITEIEMLDVQELDSGLRFPGQAPVFCIKEKGVDQWITLDNLSSGMQKVLLILTDVFVLPKGGIYFIDEYENSLGVSAINFLPTLLSERESDAQFFITSHHPYAINAIPVDNWYVLHRKGSEVRIKYGDELVKRFGKSKQQAFVQLLNDPFYVEGID